MKVKKLEAIKIIGQIFYLKCWLLQIIFVYLTGVYKKRINCTEGGLQFLPDLSILAALIIISVLSRQTLRWSQEL